MNQAHIKLLQDRYIEAVNGYVTAYNDKHKCSPVCWLRGEIGGTLIYDNGKRIDFLDIKADIDNDVPVVRGLAAQTDETNSMSKDEVCGNCGRSTVQCDGNYCRCHDGSFHKYLDKACDKYKRGGNQ